MRDSRERFGAAAGLYEAHRPSYPEALLDWIAAETRVGPPAPVADVGCGTGISTRLLARRGYEVVGVDPNEPMLERARAAEQGRRIDYPGGARYVQGQAEATGLPEASVDLVTVAQAFHWFDQAAALAEFRRILRPGGWCAAFWNLRASSPFMDAYDEVLRRYSHEYSVLLSHDQSLEALAASGAVLDVRKGSFPNVQELDRAGLHGRAGSSSYVVHGVADRDGFERALDVLFDAHVEDGRVCYLYDAVGLCFRIAPGGV